MGEFPVRRFLGAFERLQCLGLLLRGDAFRAFDDRLASRRARSRSERALFGDQVAGNLAFVTLIDRLFLGSSPAQHHERVVRHGDRIVVDGSLRRGRIRGVALQRDRARIGAGLGEAARIDRDGALRGRGCSPEGDLGSDRPTRDILPFECPHGRAVVGARANARDRRGLRGARGTFERGIGPPSGARPEDTLEALCYFAGGEGEFRRELGRSDLLSLGRRKLAPCDLRGRGTRGLSRPRDSLFCGRYPLLLEELVVLGDAFGLVILGLTLLRSYLQGGRNRDVTHARFDLSERLFEAEVDALLPLGCSLGGVMGCFCARCLDSAPLGGCGPPLHGLGRLSRGLPPGGRRLVGRDLGVVFCFGLVGVVDALVGQRIDRQPDLQRVVPGGVRQRKRFGWVHARRYREDIAVDHLPQSASERAAPKCDRVVRRSRRCNAVVAMRLRGCARGFRARRTRRVWSRRSRMLGMRARRGSAWNVPDRRLVGLRRGPAYGPRRFVRGGSTGRSLAGGPGGARDGRAGILHGFCHDFKHSAARRRLRFRRLSGYTSYGHPSCPLLLPFQIT